MKGNRISVYLYQWLLHMQLSFSFALGMEGEDGKKEREHPNYKHSLERSELERERRNV